MKRARLLLLALVIVGGGLFAGSYFASRRICQSCCAAPDDDLAWLQMEFHVSNAELARIRQLHEGYLPECADFCTRIAAQRREIAALPTAAPDYAKRLAEAQQKLTELRTECQRHMLEHFEAVSRAMPPAEGARYLERMRAFTLGTNQPMEHAMPGAQP
jgi:hypothetical protein